jgi:hypothetical protein
MILHSLCTLLTFQALLTSSASAEFFTPMRFQNWFEFHNEAPHVSDSVCSHTLSLYKNGFRTLPHTESTQLLCYDHMDCVLDALGPSTQSAFGSALVLLGLTPAILAGVGFTVGEIAYIALHRPGLSFLLSMGSPVVFSGRVMAYSDPEKAWQNTTPSKFVLNGMDARVGAVLSMLQYIFAAGSIANIFTLVVDISARTITTFDCSDYYKPVIWALVPIFMHFMATIPYLVGSRRSGNLYTSPWLHSEKRSQVLDALVEASKGNSSQSNTNPLPNPTAQPAHKNLFRWAKRHIIEEVTVCACRPPVSLSSTTRVPLWSVFFNNVASIVGLVHIIFGTLLFTSVYFIRVEVVVYCIFRFIMSAVVCRLILIVEFAGMRGDTGEGG